MKNKIVAQEITAINSSTWTLLVGSNLWGHSFRIYETTGGDIQISHFAAGTKPITIPGGSQYKADILFPVASPHGDGTGIYAKTVSESSGTVEFESTRNN